MPAPNGLGTVLARWHPGALRFRPRAKNPHFMRIEGMLPSTDGPTANDVELVEVECENRDGYGMPPQGIPGSGE